MSWHPGDLDDDGYDDRGGLPRRHDPLTALLSEIFAALRAWMFGNTRRVRPSGDDVLGRLLSAISRGAAFILLLVQIKQAHGSWRRAATALARHLLRLL